MRQTITFGIDADGYPVSRKGSQVAYLVLEYAGLCNSYQTENREVISFPSSWAQGIRWTRKVPANIKQIFKRYWNGQV